jgi:hypothetical protein
MVGLNRGLVSDPAAPFGGVKQSGLGREGGHEGMLEFMETQYISAELVGMGHGRFHRQPLHPRPGVAKGVDLGSGPDRSAAPRSRARMSSAMPAAIPSRVLPGAASAAASGDTSYWDVDHSHTARWTEEADVAFRGVAAANLAAANQALIPR